MDKIYLSGRITGIEKEAPALFKAAEEEVKALGYEPVNPFTISPEEGKTWVEYMRDDIKALCDCKAIYLLSNWEDSKGAKAELTVANILGLTVHYQKVHYSKPGIELGDLLEALESCNNVESIKFNTTSKKWTVRYLNALPLDHVPSIELIEFLNNA